MRKRQGNRAPYNGERDQPNQRYSPGNEQTRTINNQTREYDAALLIQRQQGWSEFARQEKGESQDSPSPRNNEDEGGSKSSQQRPWQDMADAQQRSASRASLSHRERVSVAILTNQIMVNAFRKFLASIDEVRHLPLEAQALLKVSCTTGGNSSMAI